VNAITLKDVATIDEEKCVECGDCIRSGVCPADAFSDPPLPFPRSVRNAFSNPITEHKETRVPGRGTEEMKTNDVRGLFGKGNVGVGLEMGRPGVSTSFVDVEKVTMAVAKIPGLKFAKGNPVTTNMADEKTGKLRPDIMGERAMSAIIETEVPIEQIGPMIEAAKKVSQEIDTVFSFEMIYRPDADRTMPIDKILKEHGVSWYPNGKFNLGLGRPLVQ
jgi:hypothetical protein